MLCQFLSTFPTCFTGKNQSLSEEDDSGNSCTIGSEVYLDVSYLHYLYDARLSISSCLRACQVWSALYDGEDPPPETYQPGVLEDPGQKSRQTQLALKKAPQPPAPHTRSCPPSNPEPPPMNQLELEWDDSFDACPVQTAEAAVESKPPKQHPAEPPKHIQEMRKSATMLVKGSYIEESDFQDDVMVYDLVAKKDTREVDKLKSRRSESEEAQREVSPKNGLSLTIPNSLMADSSRNSLDSKVKGQTDCNSSPQKNTSEFGDLLAQYEDLIRTLDTEAGGKQVKTDGEVKKSAIPTAEEEDMDFTSFSAETPEPEKLHSPFGKFFSGGAVRSHSVPFTGKLVKINILQQQHLLAKISFKDHFFPPAGPFISVLLSRMENMLSNPLHVNLLLTGILAQLAAYPQPLLRSFLLNTNLVFQPTVRSLYQVH